MNRNEIDWERLDRYIGGDGTPEDLDALRRWMESDPELQLIAETMRTAQRLPGATPPAWDADRSWRAVAERLGLPSEPGTEHGQQMRHARRARDRDRSVLRPAQAGGGTSRMPWHAAALIAASVLVVLGVNHWTERELVRRAESAASTGTGREYVAPRGQRLVVYLPDRTEITLAPETRVRLSPTYGEGERAVELVGQAYFVVTHDSTRPFSVRTDRLIARDLGTRFAMSAYPGDSAPEVVVAEGLVALGRSSPAPDSGAAAHARPAAPPDSLLLRAGDLGRLTASGRFVRTRGVRVENLLAWTEGRLVFRGTPLREAATELGRWYDVDIRLGDAALGDEQVTASFKDESAPVAMRLIAAAAGLEVEQRGTEFILRRKHG